MPPLRTPTRRNINPQIYREMRKTQMQDQFFPNAIESWSVVIINFHVNITFRRLKIHLLCLMRPMYQRVFSIYHPKGIKYFFQLRMNLSPLR